MIYNLLSSANGDKQIDRRTNRTNRGAPYQCRRVAARNKRMIHGRASDVERDTRTASEWTKKTEASLRPRYEAHRFISRAWLGAIAHVGNVKSVSGT